MTPHNRHALKYAGWSVFALSAVGLSLAYAPAAGPLVRPVACCLLLALVVGIIGYDLSRRYLGPLRARLSLHAAAEMLIIGTLGVSVLLAVRSGLAAIL